MNDMLATQWHWHIYKHFIVSESTWLEQLLILTFTLIHVRFALIIIIIQKYISYILNILHHIAHKTKVTSVSFTTVNHSKRSNKIVYMYIYSICGWCCLRRFRTHILVLLSVLLLVTVHIFYSRLTTVYILWDSFYPKSLMCYPCGCWYGLMV